MQKQTGPALFFLRSTRIFPLFTTPDITAAPPVASDYRGRPPLTEGGAKPAVLMAAGKDVFAPARSAPRDDFGTGHGGPCGQGGSVMTSSEFLPELKSCDNVGTSFGCLPDTFAGLPKPEFGRPLFLESDNLEDRGEPPPDGRGDRPVGDCVGSAGGKSAAASFAVAGTNESKTARFEIGDGAATVLKLPGGGALHGGVLSWREELDFAEIGEE
jgi:hypothetical protein